MWRHHRTWARKFEFLNLTFWQSNLQCQLVLVVLYNHRQCCRFPIEKFLGHMYSLLPPHRTSIFQDTEYSCHCPWYSCMFLRDILKLSVNFVTKTEPILSPFLNEFGLKLRVINQNIKLKTRLFHSSKTAWVSKCKQKWYNRKYQIQATLISL